MAEEKEKIKRDEYQKSLSVFNQAMKEFHKGAYEKAAQLLKAFVEKYTTEKEFVDRACIYFKICEEMSKKESFPPKTYDDYYEQGVVKLSQGEYQEALKLLEKAREMKPEEGKVYYLIADVYCLLGKEENCLESLMGAIQLDKSFGILAQNEPDFESMWENKKFKIITRMA